MPRRSVERRDLPSDNVLNFAALNLLHQSLSQLPNVLCPHSGRESPKLLISLPSVSMTTAGSSRNCGRFHRALGPGDMPDLGTRRGGAIGGWAGVETGEGGCAQRMVSLLFRSS